MKTKKNGCPVANRKRYLAFGVLFFLICGVTVHAQQKAENCPWLNAATAAGVLGGEVTMVVTDTAKGGVEQPNGAPPDTTCEFTLVHGTSAAVLRIVVHTVQDSKEYPALVEACGSPAIRVVGVGNEAISCSIKKEAVVTERIVGRVRQRAFVLSLSKPISDNAGGDEEALAALHKLQNTAEQIAGSLF